MQKCVILCNIFWGEQTIQNKTESLTKKEHSDHIYQHQKDSKIWVFFCIKIGPCHSRADWLELTILGFISQIKNVGLYS